MSIAQAALTQWDIVMAGVYLMSLAISGVGVVKFIVWIADRKGLAKAKAEDAAHCKAEPCRLDGDSRECIADTARMMRETADNLRNASKCMERVAAAQEQQIAVDAERFTGLFKGIERLEKSLGR